MFINKTEQIKAYFEEKKKQIIHDRKFILKRFENF